MKNKLVYIIISILVVVNFFSVIKIYNLEFYINDQIKKNNLEESNIVENNLRNEMNTLYSNLERKIKEENLIIESYDLEVGEELNLEDFTVDVKLKVIPKEYIEGTKASFQLNDRIIEMYKDGISFIGETKLSIFDENKIKFILDENGVQKVEAINESINLKDKSVLDIVAYFIGSTTSSKKDNRYSFIGNIEFMFLENENNGIEKITVLKEKNGKLIDKIELDVDGAILASQLVPFEEKFILEKGDKLELYGVVETSNGIIYKYPISKYESDGSDFLKEENRDNILTEIIDKSGKVIYKY